MLRRRGSLATLLLVLLAAGPLALGDAWAACARPATPAAPHARHDAPPTCDRDAATPCGAPTTLDHCVLTPACGWGAPAASLVEMPDDGVRDGVAAATRLGRRLDPGRLVDVPPPRA